MQISESPYCGCLYYSANALSRIVTRMAEEHFAPTGLAPSHAFLLMSVIRQPGLSAGDAAALMQLTPSTVTRLAEKCLERGLMTRTTEGKYTLLHATPAGEALGPELLKAWQAMSARFQDKLGDAAARSLTGTIAKAADALEQ
jgi:DNA-binding MarR family transcriptional regulator